MSNAPLGIGVAGLGRAGTFHLERLNLREDCRVVAAFDNCADASHKAAGLVAELASTWDDLVRRETVELVLLATPPASHAPLATAALSAGKHVLVETPLCLNLAEADAIISQARRASRSVIVAHTDRWDADFRTAQGCLHRGDLGRPRVIKRVGWQYSLPRRISTTGAGRPASAPLSSSPCVPWRSRRSTGGGALWEFGVHYFDQLLQLAGESPTDVYLQWIGHAPSDEADDGFLALFEFPSGSRAQIEINRGSPITLQTGWIIVGSRASYAGGRQFTVTADGEVVDVPVGNIAGNVDDLYTAIVNHIRCGGPNPVPAEQARETIALIEIAQRIAR